MRKTIPISLLLLVATTSLEAAYMQDVFKKSHREKRAGQQAKNFLGYIKVEKSSKGTLGIGKASIKKCKPITEKELKKEKKYKEKDATIKIGYEAFYLPIVDDHKKPVFSILKDTKGKLYYCVALPYRVICVGEKGYWILDDHSKAKDKDKKVKLKNFDKLKDEYQITKDVVNMATSKKIKKEVDKLLKEQE